MHFFFYKWRKLDDLLIYFRSLSLHILINSVLINFKMDFTMCSCICRTLNNFLAITDSCCPLIMPSKTACSPFSFTVLVLTFSVTEQNGTFEWWQSRCVQSSFNLLTLGISNEVLCAGVVSGNLVCLWDGVYLTSICL